MHEILPAPRSPEAELQIGNNKNFVARIALILGELQAQITEKAKTDFAQWEIEMQMPDTSDSLCQVKDTPDQSPTAWVEGNPDGTVTEDQYRQQSHSVFSEIGIDLDSLKSRISTEGQAREWLAMKNSLAQALAEADAYKLADIRMRMFPIWREYLQRAAKFSETNNLNSREDFTLIA